MTLMPLTTLTREDPLSITEQLYQKVVELWYYILDHLGELIWRLIMVVVILILARIILFMVSRWTKGMIEQAKRRNNEQHSRRVSSMMTLFRSVARYGIYFIAAYMILGQFNLTSGMSSLIAAAGIGSVAIGFGAQSLVKDVVTGLFMMFENQFSVGDYIKTETEEGTVEATALRVTYLRNPKGEQVIIPNGSISRVINYSRGYNIARLTISTAYEADTRQVMEVIAQAAEHYAQTHQELVEGEPVVLGITEFAGSSVDIGLTCRVKPAMQWEVERGLRLAIKEEFDRRGVEFPYPHVVTVPGSDSSPVLFHQQPKERKKPDWAAAMDSDGDDD